MEQIKANYHPCVKRKEPYAPLLKAKVSPESAHFWDENGVERKPPEDWRNARMHFRLQVSHLWIMNGGFGLIIDVTDAKVISEGAAGARRPGHATSRRAARRPEEAALPR